MNRAVLVFIVTLFAACHGEGDVDAEGGLLDVCAGKADGFPCATGQICLDGTCSPTECEGDADCGGGDTCFEPDTCVAGRCLAGDPVPCDDDDPCTLDACDGATGCTHTFIDEDGDGYAPFTCRAEGSYAALGGDCNDAIALASPEGMYQERPYCEDGTQPNLTYFPCEDGSCPGFECADGSTPSFDYDCDGEVLPAWPSAFTECEVYHPQPRCRGAGWVGEIPECGHLGTLRTCDINCGDPTEASAAQRCR